MNDDRFPGIDAGETGYAPTDFFSHMVYKSILYDFKVRTC